MHCHGEMIRRTAVRGGGGGGGLVRFEPSLQQLLLSQLPIIVIYGYIQETIMDAWSPRQISTWEQVDHLPLQKDKEARRNFPKISHANDKAAIIM